MKKLEILRVFPYSSFCGLVDKILDFDELGHVFESRDFLRPLDRFKILIRIIISEFYMAWRKKLLK